MNTIYAAIVGLLRLTPRRYMEARERAPHRRADLISELSNSPKRHCLNNPSHGSVSTGWKARLRSLLTGRARARPPTRPSVSAFKFSAHAQAVDFASILPPRSLERPPCGTAATRRFLGWLRVLYH